MLSQENSSSFYGTARNPFALDFYTYQKPSDALNEFELVMPTQERLVYGAVGAAIGAWHGYRSGGDSVLRGAIYGALGYMSPIVMGGIVAVDALGIGRRLRVKCLARLMQ